MKRIMCIWFPRWPIQRFLAEAPHNQERAIVVYAPAHRGQQVLVCNEPADRLGIMKGMPLSEACSLLDRQKLKVHLCLHDYHADQAALEHMALACEKFSPLVGIESAPLPESLLLDVTGLERLFGGEAKLAQQAFDTLTARGYQARVAIADTPSAAWALAHCVAEEFQPAIGRSGTTKHLLALPLAGLQLSHSIGESLLRLGFTRIGEVARIDRSSLKARFGPEIGLRLDYLFGQRAEMVLAYQPSPGFQEHWAWESPTGNSQAFEHVLRHLLHRLVLSLELRQQGILELECKLDLEDTRPLILSLHLFQPSADAKNLYELLRMQLERNQMQGRVAAIHVIATKTASMTWRQRELFAETSAHHSQSLVGLVNRLTNRLGRERVVRVRLNPKPVPEHSYGYLPWITKETKTHSKAAPAFSPWERPLWLLPKPVPLRIDNFTSENLPAIFVYERVKYEVAEHGTPERIESAWWRGRMIRRDYYRIVTRTGQRFWLFERLQDQQWFMHGEFL